MHSWKPTGKEGIHTSFPTKTNGVYHLPAIYVRCENCGQMGFRKPGSLVVYTWARDYDLEDYSTWTRENLLDHQGWLFDELPNNPHYVDYIVEINNVLEDRCEDPPL